MTSRDSRAVASGSGSHPYAQARHQVQPSRYDGHPPQAWQPDDSAALAQRAIRNLSTGPSHQLPRHRSASRLTDSWQSSAPHALYHSDEYQAARSYSQAFTTYGHPYQEPSPAERNATPSMTPGPSATPSSSSRNWANGPRTEQYPARELIADQTYPGLYYDARYAAPAPYLNEVKRPHTGPRSSSIGPWLRNAYPASQNAHRSSSVWSQSQFAGRGPDEAGPSRMRDFYSPAYSRSSSAAYGGPHPAAGPFRVSRPPETSQRYSEHPGVSDVADFRATPISSAPARIRSATSVPRRSVSTALPGSAFNATALSYIQRALSKAPSNASSPITKIPRVVTTSSPRKRKALDVAMESASDDTAHLEPISNAEDGVPFAGEEEEVLEDGSMRKNARIPHEAPNQSQAEEVADFDDGDDLEIRVATTALAKGKKARKQAPKAAKTVKMANPKAVPPVPMDPITQQPSVATVRSTIAAKRQLKRLTRWFIFSQRIKRLPKPVSNKLRTSPFNRMFDSDELGSTTSWIRVAGQLSSDDLAQHVKDDNINIEDFKWETSLVIGARRAQASEFDGQSEDALVVTTSSGADYLLIGPMNLDATIEAGGLAPTFWRDFQESGGLGEEGWEALILRAYLEEDRSSGSRPRPSYQTAHVAARASIPAQVEERTHRPTTSSTTAVVARPSRTVAFQVKAPVHRATPRLLAVSASSTNVGKARKSQPPQKEPRSKSSTPSPSSKGTRGSRELAGLIASPFGTLTAVQEALQEMGLVLSASEDEESDPIAIPSNPYGTRRQAVPAQPPTASPHRRTKRPRLISVTSLKEQHLSDEPSEVSDSADEYQDDELRRGLTEEDDSSEEEISFRLGGKREAAKAELGSPSKRTSKRARTLTSDRKWWELPSPGTSTTKPVPRAILEARRRENKSKRHTN